MDAIKATNTLIRKLQLGLNFRITWNEVTRGNIYAAYRYADKSQARPDWKKQLKGRHFSSHAEVIITAEIWLDGKPSEFFFEWLAKLEFGRCSLFPSWSG